MEVIEHLSANKAMFNVLLENYPSILNYKNIADDKSLKSPFKVNKTAYDSIQSSPVKSTGNAQSIENRLGNYSK